MDMEPTAGIILAAGMSTRFDSLKQLFKIGETTILSMIVDATLESDLERIVLVLGHQSDNIMKAIGNRLDNPKLKVIINPRYKEGMSGSLQRGLEEIKNDFPSIMIILGDQPLLDTSTINLLLHRFRSSDRDICVPIYKGNRGQPVCISNRFYSDIMEITGDIGARHIIEKNPEHIMTVEVDNPDCFFDVDKNDDVEKLLSKFKPTKVFKRK